jgi:hypothetical protein
MVAGTAIKPGLMSEGGLAAGYRWLRHLAGPMFGLRPVAVPATLKLAGPVRVFTYNFAPYLTADSL